MEKINNKLFSVKKLVTENKDLYGSIKPTEISKLVYENLKIEIKPSLIQPLKEIKSVGTFKVKIDLHSEVQAEIKIKVETIEEWVHHHSHSGHCYDVAKASENKNIDKYLLAELCVLEEDASLSLIHI